MNLSFFIARRYLFSKKKRNVINVINWVTLGGIAIGSAAIVLVLSTFNGLSNFISEMYASMDPDIKIVASQGRLITQDTTIQALLLQQPQIEVVTETIEGKILVKYRIDRALVC